MINGIILVFSEVATDHTSSAVAGAGNFRLDYSVLGRNLYYPGSPGRVVPLGSVSSCEGHLSVTSPNWAEVALSAMT